MEVFVKDLMKDYKPIVIEREKIIRQIKENSLLEKTKENYFLHEDGEICITTTGKTNKIQEDPTYVNEIKEKVDKLKMKLLAACVAEGYFEKNEGEQNVLLTKLYLNLTLLFNGKMEFGYLSLKSNIIYFNAQLAALKGKVSEIKLNKYYSLANELSSFEEKFVNEKMELFLSENKNLEFKKNIEKLYSLFILAFQNKKLNTTDISNGDRFFENSEYLSEVPEFHKKFFSNQDFLNAYKSENFIAYKYTVDAIYQLMPLLNVSPVRKQKITKMVSDKVEKNFNITWEDSYNNLMNYKTVL